MWIVLVGVVGVLLGTQYRRMVLSRSNLSRLKPVASLADTDIWHVAWSPQRDRMAIVYWEKPVEIRDAFSLEKVETIGVNKKIISFAFSSDPEVVAFAENGNTAVILDRRAGVSHALAVGDPQPSLDFSPDRKLLATAGYGTTVKLWNVSDGTLAGSFSTGPATGGLFPKFSPDGRLLAVGNRNSTTTLFDVATGSLVATLPKAQSLGLAFHHDGRSLAVAYVDASVAVWRIPEGRLVHERKTRAEELYTLDWSPDGSMLVTAGKKGPITFWGPATMSVLAELIGPEWISDVKFSPDGLNLHTSGGSDSVGGKRRLEVLGVEGPMYSLLNRRK